MNEPKEGGFFGSLKRGLIKTGETAEKYGRLGAAKVELELEESHLNRARAKLGEAAAKFWAENVGVALPPDLNRIAELLNDVREAEQKKAVVEDKIKRIKGSETV
jgi:hypothetical protein